MLGKLGRDHNGEEMLIDFKRAGLNKDSTLFVLIVPSGCSVITLEKGEDSQTNNRITILPGANTTLMTDEVAFLEAHISDFDFVMVQLEILMLINEFWQIWRSRKMLTVGGLATRLPRTRGMCCEC